MPTIRSLSDRAAILARLDRLTPDTRPQWGTLTAPRLLCHLADQLRMGLGDLPAQSRASFLTTTVLKWLVVYSPLKTPPGKVQTLPEMLTTSPTTWTADLATCRTLIERLSTASAAPPHPTFGRLSPEGWGRLAWKHLDHHLRQFGV
jgi:hypothetical protein